MMNQVINSAYRNYKSATEEVQKVMQNLAEGKPDLNVTDTVRLTKNAKQISHPKDCK